MSNTDKPKDKAADKKKEQKDEDLVDIFLCRVLRIGSLKKKLITTVNNFWRIIRIVLHNLSK